MRPDNFLYLEPLIKDALRARLDPHVFVLSAADLHGVAEEDQLVPAVHVLYTGYRTAGAGCASHAGITQQWLTVVAVAHTGDITGGEDARRLAGPIAAAVFAALHYRSFPDASPLQLTQAPAAGFTDGFFYLPLAWEALLTLETETCPPP